MAEISFLVLGISFYVFIPVIFFVARKKWIKAIKKESASLETLKLRKKIMKIGSIFIFSLIGVYAIFRYKYFISDTL